ncbi:MAG: hypothetical protein PHG05_00240 [Candidatus Nanoarchaeia archaeon]|nr:hypothetical protein [Candidatus Nanoarchaeia archaeon]
MICEKCKKNLTEEGKCEGCNLPPEECTCSVAEETSEPEESEESQSTEESTEEETTE